VVTIFNNYVQQLDVVTPLPNNYITYYIFFLISVGYRVATLIYINHISILARVTNANPSHTTMLMVSAPYHGPFSWRRGTNPSLLHWHLGLNT
jgi:hypothetical protein